jgi:hypothetical protein
MVLDMHTIASLQVPLSFLDRLLLYSLQNLLEMRQITNDGTKSHFGVHHEKVGILR